MTEPEFNDELLSAYLDGELDDAERAVVESRLAEYPAARQMLEDLRSVSNSVRELPRASSLPQTRERILEQIAEKRELPHGDRVTPVRRLLWPLMAVAALLLLMFTQGKQEVPAGREVAVVRPDENDKPVEEENLFQNEKIEDRDESGERDRSLGTESLSRETAPLDRTTRSEAAPAIGELRSHLESSEPAVETRPSIALDSSAPTPATGVGNRFDTLPLGGAGGSGELAAIRTAGLEGDVGLVHLTVRNIREGNDRFNRVLEGNGVVILDESPAQPASEPAGDSTARRIAAEGENAENQSITDGSSRSSRTASPESAAGTMAATDQKGTATAGTQMVLVEAPPQQMEQVLMSCKQDTDAIEEVVIDEATTAQVSPAATEQLSRYRSYNKVMPQKAKNETFDITPAQRGVIAVLNSLPAEQSDATDALSLQYGAAVEQNRAWAAPIRDYQEAEQYQQLRQRNQYFMPQSASGKQAEQSKKLAKANTLSDGAKDELGQADEPQVRVLFLLHPRSAE